MIRFFDVVLSGVALVVLSPLLLGVALILRFTGEREVFYRQTRIGRDGKRFELLKFATMLKNSPNIGTGVLTVKDDPRVLPVGRWLRKTKINELPQLLNVFRGEMSVIGRRPLATSHFELLPPEVQKQLSQAKPGLSGIGSIVFRDEESLMSHAVDKERFFRDVVMPYKADVELWYLERRSVGLYFALIFLTAWQIVVPRSALYRSWFTDLPPAPPELSAA